MLELLLLTLLSPQSNGFFQHHQLVAFQQDVEVLQPVKSPQRKEDRMAPKLLESPDVAVLSLDMNTRKELFSHHADRAQEIASLTKIMTAFIILEHHDLDDIVTIPLEPTQAGGVKIDLYQYEQLTVRTLLEAALIPSANDAAVALAIHHAGSEEAFVREMNEKARALGLRSAKFYNATGLDIIERHEQTPEQLRIYGNKMSARDLLKLTRLALRNDFFRETVAKKHFFGTSIDEEFFHEKASTNQLLGSFLDLKGVKTGYTELAGQCFIALGQSPEANQVLTVILGSADRFGETKKLLSWIYDSFEWR